MKSGNIDGVGQKWITFQAGSDPYGFVRDGQWHTVEIPMSDMAPEVDLLEVSQLFQVLGVSGPISNIEFDDIYFTGGGSLHTNVVSAEILDGVGISWPTTRRHELHRAMDGRPGHQCRLEQFDRANGGRRDNPFPVRAVRDFPVQVLPHPPGALSHV